ncbi:hypothetical protein LX32DRAFT_341586 [Colletotrichum zoysiae]|uniref:Uncharacterized protein n=1 Tax=Colletotrichum zoysiae TaxID=1216348 RepID=A0AAD9M5Q3_9PEZI|nr:hypothetical protein LX32DRAFT_341586 [Colletotrichum zoysiae]
MNHQATFLNPGKRVLGFWFGSRKRVSSRKSGRHHYHTIRAVSCFMPLWPVSLFFLLPSYFLGSFFSLKWLSLFLFL